jgi:FO synthase
MTPISRALSRAAAGKALDLQEASALLTARGHDLDELLDLASKTRDAGLSLAQRPGVITFSKKVFIPLTRLCRDRCHYCTFATVPHRLPAAYLDRDEVLEIARAGARLGCKEALFTLGDRPEERWPQAAQWLAERGYASTLDYLRSVAIAVLEETGLLPHLNPGVMSWEEMQRLRPVAPSMGMMLETTAERLWSEKDGPHYGSPDKEPRVRLRVLEDAGRIGIPFTTGILIGIGETHEERVDSLFAIRRIHRQYGHIQEVIVQNFRAKPDTAMRSAPDASIEDLAATVAVARLILGPGMRVQAPPNLIDGSFNLLIRAGIDDWGGVSPLTPDHVNPERPWPFLDDLAKATADAGFHLRERLTVYPSYVDNSERWIDPRITPHVRALADGAMPRGLPWQEPETVAFGRTELHAEIDTVGRVTDRRGDFDSVYGDWKALSVPAPMPIVGDVAAGLRIAREDPAALLDPANESATLALFQADGAALDELCRLADEVRAAVNGDEVTYVVNRNINFSNVCYVGCRFCAFAQRERDADAYRLTVEEVAQRALEAFHAGATEVCMQGGIDPKLPTSVYPEMVRAIKRAVPSMHVHAFSPMEIVTASAKAGVSIHEWLSQLKEAGLDTIPGTAAEILDDEVRWILTKGKLPTSAWVEVIETAHSLGIRSSSTMMYGHVDNPRHWVGHFRVLARIQDNTGGFTEFVALPFVHTNSPIYLAGLARSGPTWRENRAVHAMARLLLHGRIPNIQCSWVKLGDQGTVSMLQGGCNDLGGTLMEETISRMAGSSHGSARTVSQLVAVATAAGRTARQRTTSYSLV